MNAAAQPAKWDPSVKPDLTPLKTTEEIEIEKAIARINSPTRERHVPGEPCSVANCTRHAGTKHMCEAHYHRAIKLRDNGKLAKGLKFLSPISEYHTSRNVVSRKAPVMVDDPGVCHAAVQQSISQSELKIPDLPFHRHDVAEHRLQPAPMPAIQSLLTVASDLMPTHPHTAVQLLHIAGDLLRGV